MKPRVILHMGSSIDGRIVPKHWPKDLTAQFNDIYEQVHQALKGDAWLVGRVTMDDFAEGEPRPAEATEAYPRTTWQAPAAASGPYAIAVDRQARLHLNMGAVNGDPIILILPEEVADDHLAELRRDGISYLFAGASAIDLPLALDILARDFGIGRLLIEGGGGINGSLLEAGLIDEISLLILPIADGARDMPTTFDRAPGDAARLTLTAIDRLDGGVLHLRYDVV